MTTNPFKIGDPVVDLAQGRPMVVLDAPADTVEDWSERNGYDLQSNYANSKFNPSDSEAVVECVYVSDVRSEPSKSYNFPVSRVALIDAHHADDGRRVADRVIVETLAELHRIAQHRVGPDVDADHLAGELDALAGFAFGDEVADEALELAEVDLLGTDTDDYEEDDDV